jgi:Na+-translocating ferredoxin:NAD+ oxidoreductase RNF subunit RnfB
MFDWFNKRKEDDTPEDGYDRRQFLRGTFIRDAMAPSMDDAERQFAPGARRHTSQKTPMNTDSTGSPLPSGEGQAQAGVARVDRQSCLAYNRSFCTVCAERCPVDGAIEVDRGKPTIIAEHCTGCGTCHSVCPSPVNAITMTPNPSSPTRTGEDTASLE